MTQQQPPEPQTETHPQAFRGIERTPEEWLRQLRAILEPKEAEQP